MVSKEDIESQYKKALKALDGEKRAAIKKAKALKGKKGKDALEQVEQEFSTKLQELESKHAEELAQVPVGEEEAAVVVVSLDTTDETCGDNPATLPVKTPPVEAGAGAVEEQGGNEGLSEKERKLEKARRKKEKQRLKELEKERELEEIAANAGPNMRVVEMEQIQSTLKPLQLSIQEVAADGHCLYRAIGAQTQQDYQQVRALCADTLGANRDEFSPFCEFTDTVTSFDDYVHQVRNSAEWGGHLELRALGMALDRPIQVFKAGFSEPLQIHEEATGEPIRLSYHHHYYALGEHYNVVVPN